MSKLPLRTELPVEETWDLSLLFKNQAEYLAAVAEVKASVTHFKEQYQGKLTNETIIIESLANLEQIKRQLSKIYGYGSLGYEADKLNADNEENYQKLPALSEFVGATLSFFDSELLSLEENVLQAVMKSDEGAPYQYYLQALLREKPHRLSAEVETVLSSLEGTLSSQYPLYLTLKFQDLTFDDFEANGKTYHNSFVSFENDYESHPNQEIRHAAWASFHKGLATFQHTAAANYINHVKTEKKMATLRGFDSVIDYLLFSQQVTREAYNRQIDVVMSEFAPVMRRYARLLQKEQGLASISLADIKMPFTQEEPQHISIAEVRKMMEEVFAVFGEEYLSIVKRSFDERWIDFPMNQTKSTGGFCSPVYDGPGYILLNWNGLLSEALVLAHELGHAAHFGLTYDRQLMMTPEASLYFIEAPSTANEVITCQYLLNQPLKAAQKRVLITEFIARTYFHNMVTHLLEADFQRKVYLAVDQEEVLNAEKLNDFFKETLEQFWGEEVVINPGAELTWMRQPHYFMGMYPYTYSAGLTVGTQIGQRIANGERDAIESWLAVLAAGGTLGPLELTAKAGVSMENADALRSAIQYVDGLLDQVEELETQN